MPKRKTQSEIDREVLNMVGDEYTFISPYVKASEPMEVRHNTCGHVYSVKWNNFKSGRRCPNCSRRLSNDEFLKRVEELVGDEYIFLDTYKSSGEKIRVRHNVCNNVYQVTPNHFLKGRRCSECHFRGRTKTNQEFMNDVSSAVGNEYTPISEYVNSRTKVKMRHNVCNKDYLVIPNDFIQGNRCPHCVRSKGEVFISRYLDSIGIKYIEEISFNDFCGDLNVPYRYDFGVIDDDGEVLALIEFDGEQHFKSVPFYGGDKGFRKRVLNDQVKNWYAYNNDINLIRIRFDEVDKVGMIINKYLAIQEEN